MSRNLGINTLLAWATLTLLAGRVQGEVLQVIADINTVLPGATGPFFSFLQLQGVDPAISGENVAFGGCVEGTGCGYYAMINRRLRVIADTMTKFPGSDQHFGFGTGGPSISGENIAFGAFDGPFGKSAILVSSNGQFRIIADTTMQAPGGTGRFKNFWLTNGAAPSISGENVAFNALTEFSGGIYAFINGSLRVIADTNMAAPGVTPARPFRNFAGLDGVSPTISGENVAFLGEWGINAFEGAGIFAYINGSLRIIAGTGTQAPDGQVIVGMNFGQRDGARPSISGENVAFRAGGGAIWGYINGSLRVIADGDTPAPGGLPGATFGGFPVSPSISGENVVFGSGVAGVGIFAYIGGSFRLIAGQSTPVPGHPDTTFDRFFLQDTGSSRELVIPAISSENVVFTADAFPPPGEHHVAGVYGCLPPPPPLPPIPALSDWGVAVLIVLLLLTGVTILILRRRRCPAAP